MPTDPRSDATKAGMTDEQWGRLTEAQKEERQKAFNKVTAVQEQTSKTPAIVQATVGKSQGNVDTRKADDDRNHPKNAAHREESGVTKEPVDRPIVHPVAPKEHTDWQRAGMTEHQWNTLDEDTRAIHKAKFADPAYRTDAQRAGMTVSQWNALSPQEQNILRERFPDPLPPAQRVTVPSPPDPNFQPPGSYGTSPPWEQINPPMPVDENGKPIDPNKVSEQPESFAHLPNAPGGRNNPTMSNFDPNSPPTE